LCRQKISELNATFSDHFRLVERTRTGSVSVDTDSMANEVCTGPVSVEIDSAGDDEFAEVSHVELLSETVTRYPRLRSTGA